MVLNGRGVQDNHINTYEAILWTQSIVRHSAAQSEQPLWCSLDTTIASNEPPKVQSYGPPHHILSTTSLQYFFMVQVGYDLRNYSKLTVL